MSKHPSQTLFWLVTQSFLPNKQGRKDCVTRLNIVHMEFLGKIQDLFKDQNHFFKDLFPHNLTQHEIQSNYILCTAVLSNFLVCKTMLFNRGYFIQGAFTNIQRLLWKNQGLFRSKQKCFQYQGLFQDMMFFQGLFKARANRVEELFSPTFVVSLLFMSSSGHNQTLRSVYMDTTMYPNLHKLDDLVKWPI